MSHRTIKATPGNPLSHNIKSTPESLIPRHELVFEKKNMFKKKKKKKKNRTHFFFQENTRHDMYEHFVHLLKMHLPPLTKNA